MDRRTVQSRPSTAQGVHRRTPSSPGEASSKSPSSTPSSPSRIPARPASAEPRLAGGRVGQDDARPSNRVSHSTTPTWTDLSEGGVARAEGGGGGDDDAMHGDDGFGGGGNLSGDIREDSSYDSIAEALADGPIEEVRIQPNHANLIFFMTRMIIVPDERRLFFRFRWCRRTTLYRPAAP